MSHDKLRKKATREMQNDDGPTSQNDRNQNGAGTLSIVPQAKTQALGNKTAEAKLADDDDDGRIRRIKSTAKAK